MGKIFYLVYILILRYTVFCRPVDQEIPEAMKNAKPPLKSEKIFGAENDKYSPKTKKEKEKEWKSEQNLEKFEGDMMLTKAVKDNLLKSGVQLRDILTNQEQRWPSKQIPYVVDPSIDAKRLEVINSAIADFNTYTCVQFVPRTAQSDYVRFNYGSGCWSWVGKIGGAQELSLGDNCIFKGVAIHEMMHSLGFFHEHTRLDRDEYVRVNFANIQEGMQQNFQKYAHGEADTYGEPYDYGSVMHYPTNAFSVDSNKETITLLKAYNGQVGQRDGFSPIDIKQLRLLFQCDTKTATPSTTSAPSAVQTTESSANTGQGGTTIATTGLLPTSSTTVSPTNPVVVVGSSTKTVTVKPGEKTMTTTPKPTTQPRTTVSPGVGTGLGEKTTKAPGEGSASTESPTPSRSPGFTTPIMPAPGVPGSVVSLPKIVLPPPAGSNGQVPMPSQGQCPNPCPTPCPTYCTQTVVRPQAPVQPQGQHQPSMQAVVQSNQPCKAYMTKGKNGECLHVIVNYPAWPNDFHWSSAGIPWNCNCNCVAMNEPMDPDGWSDNYLCYRSKIPIKNPIIKWSHQGPIPNMRCVRLSEPSDPDSWNDNFLCTPHDSPYQFSWSPRGPINKNGVKCIKIDEPNETNEWRDNFLCAQSYP